MHPQPQQPLPPHGQVFSPQSATNPRNLKKKNKGNGNQGSQGNQPSEPQGRHPNTNNQRQGSLPKKNKALHMNKLCACCGVHDHYTYECPLLPNMCQIWEAQVGS